MSQVLPAFLGSLSTLRLELQTSYSCWNLRGSIPSTCLTNYGGNVAICKTTSLKLASSSYVSLGMGWHGISQRNFLSMVWRIIQR